MKKIKIIDLLNKIANGEEVPEKINFNGEEYRLNYANTYVDKNGKYIFQKYNNLILNDEVEIIEEPQPTKEEIKEYTNKFLEVWTPIKQQFGKLFDELIRIKNDLGLNLEDNIKEEPQEHKIPEKLDYKYRNLYGRISQCKQSEIRIIDKINEILDYLEEIE